MRRKIKAMSYGLAYGLSAFGLSQQLNIEAAEARGLMDTYFERFGGVRDYLRRAVDEARATGYTATMLRPPPLSARPQQRQPAAPRGGRADGAQRADPGHRGGHRQDRDAARWTRRCGRPASPPACCSRSTTKSSWRSRRASGRPVGGAGPPGDGRRRAADVPAGRLGGRRAGLGVRRALASGGWAAVPVRVRWGRALCAVPRAPGCLRRPASASVGAGVARAVRWVGRGRGGGCPSSVRRLVCFSGAR